MNKTLLLLLIMTTILAGSCTNPIHPTSPSSSSGSLIVTPDSLNFGFVFDEIDLNFKDSIASDTVRWTASTDQTWITLDQTSGIGNSATIQVSIDHNSMSPGTYQGHVKITEGTHSAILPVSAKASDWRKAAVILPMGTQYFRFHVNDDYTYSYNRYVYVGLESVGDPLGWATFVYNDAFDSLSGHHNPPFTIGSGQIIANGPLHDGDTWTIAITCQKDSIVDFFGFKGLDGTLRFESPKWNWDSVLSFTAFKVKLDSTVYIKCSVAPRPF